MVGDDENDQLPLDERPLLRAANNVIMQKEIASEWGLHSWVGIWRFSIENSVQRERSQFNLPRNLRGHPAPAQYMQS